MTRSEQPREQIKLSLASEILRSSGRLQFTALGNSMLPTLWPGDVLTIESIPFKDALPGQLALYYRSESFFVHRVVRGITASGGENLVTRGDSMSFDDTPVSPAEWLGIVTAIRRRGRSFDPALRRTPTARVLGWMLGSSDHLRSVALRLHAWTNVSSAVAPVEVLPG